jgi:hypothetical protein
MRGLLVNISKIIPITLKVPARLGGEGYLDIMAVS